MILSTNISKLRQKYRADNYIAFSLDIDWVGEDLISETVDFFIENEMPLTVFCTHPSIVLANLSDHPLIELGIHPNYTVGSSQGSSIDEVTDYCLNLVPGARCMRGHRWYRSNDVYDTLVERGILFDSNECSMMDIVEPYIHRSGIMCIPVFFEDGGLLWNNVDPVFADNGARYFSEPGLKVVDLHPIHFMLNTPSYTYYRDLSDSLSRGEYSTMSAASAAKYRYRGIGMRDYIMELVEFVKANNVNVTSLGRVYDELEYYTYTKVINLETPAKQIIA